MYRELTAHRKPVREKLLSFGFEEKGDLLSYQTRICEGEFSLVMIVGKDGSIDTELYDLENECEYVLYKTDAAGEYVGMVRSAVRDEVAKVVSACYEDASFWHPQTLRLIKYVKDTYGDDLDFLWENTRDYAVFKNKSTKKWYGLIAAIPLNRIGRPSSERGEILVFRCKLEELPPEYAQLPILPGYHMNKKSWATIVLDESVNDRDLFQLIDRSFASSETK